MFGLMRSAMTLAVLGALAFVAFFVNVGGKPFASHVLDVWRSPVMQEKVELVRGEVKRGLEERLAASGAEVPQRTTPAEFDDHDAAALERMLGAKK
jgi:hypothetical protein